MDSRGRYRRWEDKNWERKKRRVSSVMKLDEKWKKIKRKRRERKRERRRKRERTRRRNKEERNVKDI